MCNLILIIFDKAIYKIFFILTIYEIKKFDKFENELILFCLIKTKPDKEAIKS